MKNRYVTNVLLVSLLCLLTVTAISCIYIECWGARAKSERQVQLSAPLSSGSLFTAQTHNGSITITGAEVADCNLIATITACAATDEEAKSLADATEVKLEPSGNSPLRGKLTAKITKPTLKRNQSIAVSLDAKLPSNTSLELSTHNGAVKISNITGKVNGTTHNGKVSALQVSGNIKLQTHNGSVVCEQITGDADLKTHNGGVRAVYSDSAPPVCNVVLVTHNGGIDLTAPPQFSARVDASTHNGSIKTDLPITVVGKVNKRKLAGTIGTGQGKLYLQTHNGSIHLR
jgi:hypothetical protein